MNIPWIDGRPEEVKLGMQIVFKLGIDQEEALIVLPDAIQAVRLRENYFYLDEDNSPYEGEEPTSLKTEGCSCCQRTLYRESIVRWRQLIPEDLLCDDT